MKFRSTLILALLLVVGAFTVYFLDYKPGEERKVEKFLDKKFITLEIDSIIEIDIVSPEEKISLIKSEDKWLITDPVKVKANQNQINNLIRNVSQIKKGRKVSNSSNLKVFGLDPSKISLYFRFKDGHETGFSIGDESPTGEFLFAKRRNNSDIFTVPKEFFTQTNKKLFNLRAKNILFFRNNEIHKISVKTRSFEYDINWDAENRKFIMSTPATLPIETGKMNAFFSRISNGQVAEFIDTEQPSKSITGLGDEETSIKLWASDPPRQEILKIGSVVTRNGKAYRYVRDASRPAIMLIDSSLAEYLERDPFEFIQKELLIFEKVKVDEIVLKYGDINIQINKKDNRWNLISPDNIIADDSRVSELLDNILSLKATTVENYKPKNVNKYGISPKKFFLSISESGKAMNSIQTGNSVGDELYIQSSKSTAIFRVSSASLDKLKVEKNYFEKKEITELEETQ